MLNASKKLKFFCYKSFLLYDLKGAKLFCKLYTV